jgi:ABC-type Fe3+ transport system permease subunit
VQVALGLLWLLDGALQLQPYMFSPKFSAQVLRPAGSGQPTWVSAVVDVSARQVAGHPVAWNASFAAIQLALGAGPLLIVMALALLGSARRRSAPGRPAPAREGAAGHRPHAAWRQLPGPRDPGQTGGVG